MKIINEYEKDTKSGKIWFYELVCDCGRIIHRPRYRHLSNINATCGKGSCNIHVKHMIGMVFDRLTIISHHSRERGYNCNCECGNNTIVRTDALKKGKIKSCGCLMRENVSKRARKAKYESSKNEIYKQYIIGAKRRKYKFLLTKDEFIKLIESSCEYCGIENSMQRIQKRYKEPDEVYKFNGIDRVDNTKGYIKENCVSCCNICNNSKSTMSLTDWKIWLHRVYKGLN